MAGEGLREGLPMRVLFTLQPAPGHLHPLVPVAEAMGRAGHAVAFCTAGSLRAEVEAWGFRCFAAGANWLMADRSTWACFPPMPPPGPGLPNAVALFAEHTPGLMAADLLAIARDWAPDLVVRDSLEFGGCLAAERLGLPHVSVAVNAYGALHPSQQPLDWHRVAAHLERHRAALGLPPDPDLRMPYRHLHLCFSPARWDGDDARPAPNARFLRHVSAVRPGAMLPAWVDDLPDRLTVLASLGTVFFASAGLLEAIVEGLREESINLIVATGRNGDPARFGDQPPHIRLERIVPQALLLARCDAFVTHGGFNSVKEALSVGVPLVVLPITGDQPYAADRCAALGVGQVVTADERAPTAIREAVRRVLDDRAYRANAERFRNEMAALPGPDQAVALLEQLWEAARGEFADTP